MRDDDAFWAARRVAAFTDELIRAAVHTGEFSDPAAEKYLGDVLIKRRDKIASIYLTAVNPDRRPAPRCERPADLRERGVRGRRRQRRRPPIAPSWLRFDNATGETQAAGGHAERDDDDRGAARPADGARQLRRGGHFGRQPRHTRRGGGRFARISAERAKAGRSWGSNGCLRVSQPITGQIYPQSTADQPVANSALKRRPSAPDSTFLPALARLDWPDREVAQHAPHDRAAHLDQ